MSAVLYPNEKAAYTCPWCGENTTHTVIAKFDDQNHHTWALVQCQNLEKCGRGALLRRWSRHRVGYAREEHCDVYPTRTVRYQPEGVPPEIARDFEEAANCSANGYHYAAAVVARRIVQAVVRHVGARGENLCGEIDSLPPETLARTLRDAAHQVRLIGNDAAHAGEIVPDDVDHLMSFTRQLLHFLFVLPHELQKAEATRTAN